MVAKKTAKPARDSYTIANAARIVGVSPRRIRQLAEEGRLEVISKDPVRVLASDVNEFKEAKEKREKEQAALPPASPRKPSAPDLLQTILEAQEAGRQQERLAIEATINEVRERAERAEQRALEAEAARRQAESSLAAIERELELEKARKKGLFNRR
jgi:hypothetical protein